VYKTFKKISIDVVLDLDLGDSAKGKICHDLCKRTEYSHVLRINGSGNADTTIYHEGKKFVMHLIPVGVYHNIKSIIGPNCVLNVKKFFEEIEFLEKNNINANNNIKIAKNAHIVTKEHLQEELGENKIGTTQMGVGPCYRDKYARTGKQAQDIPELKNYIIDMHEEFYDNKQKYVLAQGAQSFFLDISFGDYPYVTSSHCGIGAVLLNGFNHDHIDYVYGAQKCYSTYVGSKDFEPKDEPIFSKIREVGKEYDSTTGRPRKINWMNINNLIKAIEMNGVDLLIMSKMDVLRELNIWKIIYNNKIVDLNSEEKFKNWMLSKLELPIKFSDTPNNI
jgi:adenylosuccinate synthase